MEEIKTGLMALAIIMAYMAFMATRGSRIPEISVSRKRDSVPDIDTCQHEFILRDDGKTGVCRFCCTATLLSCENWLS